MNQQMHNEFDNVIVVCSGCAEFVNEGIQDDREMYHSPVPSGLDCDQCGASACQDLPGPQRPVVPVVQPVPNLCVCEASMIRLLADKDAMFGAMDERLRNG